MNRNYKIEDNLMIISNIKLNFINNFMDIHIRNIENRYSYITKF